MDLNGEALRVIRERTGLNQGQLAALAGLKNASHISNIEAGRRRPSPEVAKALADALKVPLAAILLGPERAA